MCTCDDVLYLCAFTLDRHTICVAVVNRVREKEMQMANCKDSRGKFKESLHFAICGICFLFPIAQPQLCLRDVRRSRAAGVEQGRRAGRKADGTLDRQLAEESRAEAKTRHVEEHALRFEVRLDTHQ